MEYGLRLIYDKNTGKILNGTFEEMSGDFQKGLRPKAIDFIDLPYTYDENNFRKALEYHIDISKDKNTSELEDLIIIDKYIESAETAEDKVIRLENELLISKGVI